MNIASLNELDILNQQELGFGYSSRVKLAKHKASGALLAVKIVG